MHVQRQIDELLSHRASEWLDMLPTATEAERTAFAEWLGESRLHVQAFLEVAEVEYRLRGIDPRRLLDVDALLSRIDSNVVHLSRPPPAPSVAPSVRPQRHRLRTMMATLAACLCALGIAALLYMHVRGPRFETAIGEQKTIELADSSVITLNALSEIDVNLQKTERDVDLRHGEAIFKVAHDPGRPFRVHTRAGTVQAVGTQFNVYDKPDGDTRVSVLEGRVQLIPRAAGNGAPASTQMLAAGEEADIHLDGTIHRNANAVVANTVAWRQRRLVFDHADLADMVAEFNRYNRTLQLRVEGVPEGAYHFDGIFDAADPESFINVLEREPELSIERRGDQVVVRPRIAVTH